MWFVVVCHLLLLVFACVVQHVDSFVPPSVTVFLRRLWLGFYIMFACQRLPSGIKAIGYAPFPFLALAGSRGNTAVPS